jgi:hypothetical protein
MDFQSMVSQFKRSVLEERNEEELEELTTHSRERVKKYIRDGTPDRHTPKYSFKRLFKDAPHFDRSGDAGPMRMAIPLEMGVQAYATRMFQRITDMGWTPVFTTKKVTQKQTRLAGDGGGVEEIELELPVLDMKKQTEKVIPKGPRAGETVMQSTSMSLGKVIQKFGTGDDQEWWSKHQNSLREMKNVQDYFLKPWMNDFKSLGQRPVIILTRHPIDVARMSDFSMTRSCHSEGSSHFNCAIDESKGHGMVAYLIKGEDWEKVKDKLNHDEIFADRDADIEGIEPVARVRLRKLFNKDTDEEFATVENRVYGINIPDFLPTVQKWARESQKDMWLGEDGKIDPSAIANGDYILVGGDHLDTQVDDQLINMFKGTEWEENAYDVWGNSQFDHEDYFDDRSVERYSEAEARVNRIQEEYDDAARNGTAYISIEEGWDDMPFFVDAGYSTEWRFVLDPEWFGSTGMGRSAVPEYGDGSSYQVRREFEKLLDEAYDAAGMYQGANAEWEFGENETGEEIVISYRESADMTRGEEEGIDEAESYLDDVVNYGVDTDENWKKVSTQLRIKLIEEEYLPPGAYQKAQVDLPAMSFKNLQVIYDEEDPYDGITILFNGGKSDTHDMAYDNVARPLRYIGTYDKFDANGDNIAGQFVKKLSTGAVKTTVNAAVRAAFKRIARKAAKQAEKQLTLQFPQDQQDMFGTPADPKYQPPDYNMPEMPMDEFTAYYATMSSAAKGTAFDIGLGMSIGIEVAVTEENYKAIMLFVKYLDNNADLLVKAGKKVADDAYNILADAARRDSEDREDMESNREYQRQHGYDGQQELSEASDANKAKLKEMLKKAIMKRLLKEQTTFETRLFQVNLKIQVDPNVGGGIEQKLNRIRAIEGVTVVGHDDLSAGGQRQVIEARVKFHPDSDALRPITYVHQTLVPEINSSKLVPGVKVIDVVKGSLKRLDK